MQKIAILYDLSQAVMSTFDLDEVLNRTLAIMRDYFQMPNSSIFLIDPHTKELYLRAGFGRPQTEAEVRQRIGEGIVGSAAKVKRPVYVRDVTTDARYIMRLSTTRSEVAIPLMVRDDVVGVLDFQSEVPDYFDNETIDLLTLFSTQASLGLENARLYSLEQRRSRQLEAINAIARQTTAVVDLDQLLEKVCRLILERFAVDHVAILLFEDGQLQIRAHHGKLTASVETGALLAPGTGIAWRAMDAGKTMLENDVTKDSRYLPGFEETQSEMCVPLIFFGEKLGTLVLDSAKIHAFDQGDIQPLEAVADICAAAIQNAKHFERTQQLAYLDGLTGIFNRRFFELRIAEELERVNRYNSSMSVIMIDIDRFKKLNDEFGHLLGDEVLRQASHIFSQQLRKGDVVCRYGGEEFALLLPQTTGENAMEVAEKLRRTVEATHFPGVPRKVTVSAGVADSPAFGKVRDEIVAAADSALYQAKQAGRNKVIAASRVKQVPA
ncbi:MAG: diguanylate cyclase with sensor [Acidobacteriales bacterium]|nr:diguanylate cyclase with sensor [Terriglobales bacterium]